MDSEILTLGLDINDNPLNQKLDAVEERITTVKEKASSALNDSLGQQNLPGYNEGLIGKMTEWQKDLDNILRTRQAIEHAGSSYEQQDLVSAYQRKVEVANKSIKDLTNSQNLAHQLTDSLGSSMSKVFSEGLEGIVTQLATGVRTTAQTISRDVSRKLTDDEIVDRYMSSPEYSRVTQSLAKSNPEVFSRQNMRQYLMATVPLNVPQYMRHAVTGDSQVVFQGKASSFRGMLPEAFQNIPVQPKTTRTLGSTTHGNETLSVDEIEALNRMVRNNRYAADAAVQAGIIGKRNGAMYFNHGTTHDMVNAMASFAMRDVVSAAKGEAKYGITDVENPAFWKSISNKQGSNKVLDSGLATMRAMQDAFGTWLDPGYYKGLKPFDVTSGNAEYVGQITHSPRKASRAFAEYTLDMMEQGAQISGVHPIMLRNGRWTELTDVTGPRKGDKNNIAVSPEDFHTMSLNDSMLQRMVAATPSASKVEHNGFSDNMIYLKHDEALGNPAITEEEREAIARRYGNLFAKGYDANGHHYVSTRIGKTHAEFMRSDIVDDIGRKALGLDYSAPFTDEIRKAGLAILANDGYVGGSTDKRKTHFDDFKTFAKTMYNASNIATEGESLESWLGADKKMKVVVGSFGDKDMDGSNWISDKVSKVGFQGRSFGGKATYVPINMEDFRLKNYQRIQGNDETAARIATLDKNLSDEERRAQTAAIMQQYGGDLIIPKAGIGGGNLVIPKDTDVIEDINNIKYFKTAPNMTQEQWNEARSNIYNDYGVFAKTTYDDANTSSRWLSKQVINSSMNAGFRDPRVAQYFDKVFYDELSRLDNDQYVRDLLFKGDQSVDLQSAEAQQKINNHVNGMWARFSEGDRLLPTGVFKYAMAAPNPQNVINNRLLEAGITLTPEQEALQLRNNDVISMESLNRQLGIIRFPATKSGNVTVNNVSAERLLEQGKVSQQQIDNLARSSGIVDTKGLYFAPNSPILKLLQGEDFDGDLNGYFGLSDNIKPEDAKEFTEVMRIIANASDKEVEEIYKGLKPGTPEFEKAVAEQEIRKKGQTYTTKDKDGGYDITNPDDRALYLANIPREHWMMGSAERSADMAALYYGGLNNSQTRSDLAQAIRDYESQYDVVSTNMKTNERWKQTEEQAKAADLGLSFSRMFKYANEAVETQGENDDSVRVWNGKSKAYLESKNIDQLGLPSMFQGGLMGTLIGRAKAVARGQSPEGGVYDWNQVLGSLAMPEGVSADSEGGKFVQMMRGVRGDFLTSKYLVASNETVDALQEQYNKVQFEAAKKFNPEQPGAIDQMNDYLKSIGGKAFENFREFGPTEANVARFPTLKKTIDDLTAGAGVQVSQTAPLIVPVSSNKPSATVEVKDRIPAAEQKQENKQPEQKHAETTAAVETPRQEARRLLGTVKGLSAENIENILNLPETQLQDIINNSDLKSLQQFKGIGQKRSEDIVQALAGSKIATLKTTSTEDLGHAVSTQTVPSLVQDPVGQIQPVTKEALEAQRKKVGQYMLNDSYNPNEWVKILQGNLALASGRTEDKHNEIKDINPEIKGRSKAEYIQFLKNEIAEMETYRNMWNEYRKQGGNGENPPILPSPPNNPPGGNPPDGNPPKGPLDDWYARAAKTRYDEVVPGAQQFARSLWGAALTSDKRLEGMPESIIQLERNEGIAKSFSAKLTDMQQNSALFNALSPDEQKDIMRLLNPDSGLMAQAGLDFSKKSVLKTDNMLESIQKTNAQASGTYDGQIEALNKWEQKIQEVEKEQERLLTMSQDPKYSEATRKEFKKNAESVDKNLQTLKSEHKRLKGYTEQNVALRNQQQDYQIDQMLRQSAQIASNPYGVRRDILYRAQAGRNQALTQLQNQKGRIDAALARERNKLAGMKEGDEGYDKTAKHVKDLAAASDQAGTSIEKLSGPLGAAGAVAAQFGATISRLATRLGRQLFHKALREAKQFVIQFERSMTNIQMITLKTDTEMSKLGDGLIAKARELKASISDITAAAETLYRQGLTDQEVNDRLEVITKFSKVSGTKTDAATKLVTIAMNTGLVTNASEAADIVTALGDNAATNASQIEKGIEKAGAAAAADGTTFGQLAAMLTAITSTTQIGGNVAGRTLNTIFGRMNKIGTGELIYDENGNAISGSAVAQLLQRQGVATYDENGRKRSSFDVLYDLSQKWDTLSDAEQQQLATAIAGTRQYSNFAAIMQGMSEGKIDEYMDLIAGSEGITDKKYDIYLQSLDASLANLKTTFDELIADLTDSGILTGLIDGLASIIKGIDNATKSTKGFGGALGAIIPLLASLVAIKIGMSMPGLTGGLIALGGLAALGVTGLALSASGNQKTVSQQFSESQDEYNSYVEKRYGSLNRLTELKNKGNRTEEETREYATLIHQNAVRFGLADGADDATYSIENLIQALKNLSPEADEAADRVIKEGNRQQEEDWAGNLRQNAVNAEDEIESRYNEKIGAYSSATNINNSGLNNEEKGLWHYDRETQQYVLNDYSLDDISERLKKTDDTSRKYLAGLLAERTRIAANRVDNPQEGDELFADAISYANEHGSDSLEEYWRNAINTEMWGGLGQGVNKGHVEQALNFAANLAEGTLTPEEMDAELTARKEAYIARFNDEGLGKYYNDDQIDYLAGLAAEESLRNGFAAGRAYILGGSADNWSFADVKANIDSKLEGYNAAQGITKMPYELENVGRGGYYLDENGNVYTEEQVRQINETQQQSDRDIAIGVMQRHNKGVIARYNEEVARIQSENAEEVETVRQLNEERNAQYEADVAAAEQAAEEQYQADLLTKAQQLYAEKGTLNFKSVNMSPAEFAHAKDVLREHGIDYDRLGEGSDEETRERIRARELSSYANGHYGPMFSLLDAETQQRYIDQVAGEQGSWESLSPEEQAIYLQQAAETVQKAEVNIARPETITAIIDEIPELDESQLIGGLNATVEQLGAFYDENAECLGVVADEVEAATKAANKGLPKFTAVNNRFLEAVEEGQSALNTKLAPAENADYITSLLMSGRFTDINDFLRYINEEDETAAGAWATVGRDAAIANVMRQATWNEQTRQYENVPEDMMEQLLIASQGISSTYGTRYLTPEQKGQFALAGYEALQNGAFVSTTQRENARNAAWEQYSQEHKLDEYQQELAAINEAGYTAAERESRIAQLRAKYRYPITSKDEFVNSQSALNADVLSYYQKQYLKEALGEEMAQRVFESREGGPELTEAEREYVERVLGNRARGLTTGLTTAEQVQGMRSVQEAINKGESFDRTVANQYMSGWSNWSEYAALLEEQRTLAESGETLSDEKLTKLETLREEFEYFVDNSDITLKVEGIQALEQAGKVASGTAERLRKLQQGGTVRIQVLTQMSTEAYASGQQMAKLYNGNTSQQDEAAMAILGMTREQYYGENGRNRDANLARAKQYAEQQQAIDARTFNELYNADGISREDRINTLANAKAAGYTLQYNKDENGNLVASFVYTGTGINSVSSLAGEQRNYTEAERNIGLEKILSGELTPQDELYESALGSAGENTRELLRRWQNENPNISYTEWLNSADIPSWLRIAAENEQATRRTSQISGFASTLTQAQQAQYALSNLNNPESAGYLAAFLGMNQDEVRQLMQKPEGVELLRNKVQESQRTFYSEMAQAFGIEIDLTGDTSQLRAQLQEALQYADAQTAAFIQWMIDSIDNAGNIIANVGNKTFSETVEESLGTTTKKQDALNRVGEVIQGGNYQDIRNDNSVDFSQISSLLLYMLNDRAVNGDNSAFTQSMIEEAYQNELMGRKSAPQTQREILSSLFGGDLSSENMVQTYSTWMQNPAQYAGQLEAFNALDGIEDVREALSSETSAVEKTTAAMKEYNQETGVKALQYAKAFGDQTDEVTDSLGRLAKGGKTAQREIAALSRKAYDTQDAMTAWYEAYNGGQVKSGKKVSKSARSAIASYLGISESEVERFTVQDMEQLFANDQVRAGIEQDMTNVANTVLNDTLNDIQAKASSGELSLNGRQITYEGAIEFIFNPDGTVNMENLMALAQAAESDAVGLLEALAQGKLGEWVATLRTAGEGDTYRAWIEATTNTGAQKKGNRYSYNNRGGSSGGGGGKSKTDSLIEGQSHYIKRREHDIKMIQARETRYEKTNNYQGYLNSLNDEIDAQQRLKDQYAANITALEEQLATVKTGSEEWYKLQEAIDSAREAMAGIDNTIDEINSKKISIVETRQANQDKPLSHASTMLGLKAQNYLNRNQFENYAAVKAKQIASYEQDIALNNFQISEWEDLIKTYEEGTQDWMTVRDKIWQLKEENAELENNILSETQELQKEKISQIATDLQNAMAPIEHEQSMLGTWSGIYQKGQQFGAYRSALTQENTYYRGNAALYSNAIKELQKQIATLEVGSEAWLNARSAIFEYQEALANVTASIQENDEAIEESYVTELSTAYQDATKTTEHELKMAQLQAQKYDKDNDFINYQNMLRVELDLTSNSLAAQRESLADMENLLNSGKLKEGSTQWKSLREQIMSLRETISQTEMDYEDLERLISQSEFEHIVERFNEQDNVRQHTIRMLQYDETKYQNAGELTNYGTVLTWETQAQQERADAIQEQIDLLKVQRDAAKDDPELYNKIENEIMKMEEQLASTNNTIAKNNEMIKQNQENIRKLAQTLENTLDKEIKDRIQFEKQMLAGTVSTQNSILEVIKDRYTKEWQLVRKDIEEKKKALSQEKSLINERLNARKAAIDAEDKYELLAEYQKQLALIAADPTRTKDAKELRKKISDLQKEISWSITEDEARAATEALDDQITALDEYVATHEEDLNEMLQDANNFKDELDALTNGTFEDYVAWMKEHNEAYQNSTEETRKQMEQSWEETWKKMRGLTDTYWEDIATLMENKDTFIDYMKQSQEYINASETGRASLEYQWSEMYDKYQASLVDNAQFEDTHKILETINDMKEWTYKVEPVSGYQYDYGQYSSDISYGYVRDKKTSTEALLYDPNDQYSSIIGSDADLYESQKGETNSSTPQIIINVSGGGSSSGSGSPYSGTKYKYEAYVEYEKTYGGKGTLKGTGEGNTVAEAKENAYNEAIKKAPMSAWTIQNKDQATYKQYAAGGLVDYTGPAWVDGTPTHPEAFLSAYDTETIRSMIDAFNYIRVNPGVIPGAEFFAGNNSSIGDINITINQAELKEDADFDEVARKIGKSFTKQLSKNGFNLANYAF